MKTYPVVVRDMSLTAEPHVNNIIIPGKAAASCMSTRHWFSCLFYPSHSAGWPCIPFLFSIAASISVAFRKTCFFLSVLNCCQFFILLSSVGVLPNNCVHVFQLHHPTPQFSLILNIKSSDKPQSNFPL